MKIMSTVELQELASIAAQEGFNRQLSPELIEALEPEGTHVVGFTLLHEHIAGVRSDPHTRMMIYAQVRGQEEPVVLFLDTPTDRWESLRAAAIG